MTALLLTLLSAVSLAATADYPHEQDMTQERQEFQSVSLDANNPFISDDTGANDITVFGGAGSPPFVIDLKSVGMAKTASGWTATFNFLGTLPKNPGYPVNFDLFVDRDGDTSNNAKTGVFRAGADTAFLLLYGTKTQWHTLTWEYDPTSARWNQMDQPVDFTVNPSSISMSIPFTLLPEQTHHNEDFRGFALTSSGGITAVDVAPGLGLPPVRFAPAPAQTTATTVRPTWVVLGILVVLFIGSVALWYRKR